MASSRRERKRANKAAGRPVRIVVCTYPNASLESVMPLLRSSVLYGDEVVLHSPLASLLASVATVAHGSVQDIVELIVTVGPNQSPELARSLEQIEANHPGQGKKLLAELLNPRSLTRAVMARQLDGLDLPALDKTFASARDDLRQVSNRQLADARFDLIDAAVRADVLTIAPVSTAFFEDVATAYIADLQGLLSEPNVYPVFDDDLSDFLAMLSRKGLLDLAEYTVSRSTQATTADRFLASLPTFPNATMDEIVDIRGELRSPLVKFRAAMIGVTADLGVTALDADYEAAVEEIWRLKVAPALDELGELVRQAGLLRTYGPELGVSLTGPLLTFGVALATGSSAAALGTAVPAASAAAVALRSGGRKRSAARSAVATNPYYFLHHTEASLQKP